MKFRKFFLLLTTYHLLLTVGNAAFRETGWSARSEAMGGVFLPASSDSAGIFYNPSSAGLACSFYDADSLYSENEGIFIAAFRTGIFAGGANLKYLCHRYNFNDYLSGIYIKNAAYSFTADFGFSLELSDWMSFSASGKNIVPADVGVKEEDIVPTVLNGVLGFDFSPEYSIAKFFGGLGVSVRNQKWEDKISYKAGIEARFPEKRFSLRAGYDSSAVTAGFGYIFKFSGCQMEVVYAFSLPTGIKNATNHRIQTIFRFGREEEKVYRGRTRAKKISQKPKKKEDSENIDEEIRKMEREIFSQPEKSKLSPAEKKKLMHRHFNKATEYYKKGKYEKAISEWQKVLEIDPNHELSKRKIRKAQQKLSK